MKDDKRYEESKARGSVYRLDDSNERGYSLVTEGERRQGGDTDFEIGMVSLGIPHSIHSVTPVIKLLHRRIKALEAELAKLKERGLPPDFGFMRLRIEALEERLDKIESNVRGPKEETELMTKRRSPSENNAILFEECAKMDVSFWALVVGNDKKSDCDFIRFNPRVKGERRQTEVMEYCARVLQDELDRRKEEVPESTDD